MRIYIALLLNLALAGAATAAPACKAKTENSSGYLRATEVVGSLPELKVWSRSHEFPVTYGMSWDKQVLLRGRCYWSVSVYANRPERFEMWHIFYVDAARNSVMVMDPVSGEPISLRTWRSRKES